MELKEFIEETVKNICDGIHNGHSYIVDNKKGTGIGNGSAINVEFIVNVVTTESGGTEVGGKIKVFDYLQFKAEKKDTITQGFSHQIKFEIPIRLDIGKINLVATNPSGLIKS